MARTSRPLHDRVVVVTGAARGIGAATAAAPVRAGGRVAIADLDADLAQALPAHACVYDRDLARARRIAARLRAGTVNVNDGHAAACSSLDAPMGGMGASGPGRRHGVEGPLKYTESQNVAVQRIQVIAPPKWIPHGRYTSVMAHSLWLMRGIGVRRPPK